MHCGYAGREDLCRIEIKVRTPALRGSCRRNDLRELEKAS